MKLFRRRRPSVKTILGITRAKRKIAKATGIPTTKSGRKRKALNTLTGGAYGKFQRTRANINRPYKTMKRLMKPGCLVYMLGFILLISVIVTILQII